jgi:uncharacterized protein YeaC (DUF1315 family)
MSFIQAIENITPEIYENLKQAVEIGKWGDGRVLSVEQKELCLQAMIAWELKNLPEEERTGYMGGQECGSKKKKAAELVSDLFAPASGTRH